MISNCRRTADSAHDFGVPGGIGASAPATTEPACPSAHRGRQTPHATIATISSESREVNEGMAIVGRASVTQRLDVPAQSKDHTGKRLISLRYSAVEATPLGTRLYGCSADSARIARRELVGTAQTGYVRRAGGPMHLLI